MKIEINDDTEITITLRKREEEIAGESVPPRNSLVCIGGRVYFSGGVIDNDGWLYASPEIIDNSDTSERIRDYFNSYRNWYSLPEQCKIWRGER